MKTKLFLGAILTVLLVGGSIFAAGHPKVTMEEAQAIAVKMPPETAGRKDTLAVKPMILVRRVQPGKPRHRVVK